MTRTDDLAGAIEQAREKASLSVREAARRAGLSDTRWRQIVEGDSTRPRTLAAMAAAVGLDPAEVLRRGGRGIDFDLGGLLIEVKGRIDTGRGTTGAAAPVSGAAHDADAVLLSLPAEATEGMTDLEVEEVRAEAVAAALRAARRIRRDR